MLETVDKYMIVFVWWIQQGVKFADDTPEIFQVVFLRLRILLMEMQPLS
jgi:hypothetical protein